MEASSIPAVQIPPSTSRAMRKYAREREIDNAAENRYTRQIFPEEVMGLGGILKREIWPPTSCRVVS